MEEEDLVDKNLAFTLEDSIEILTTDDKRLKVIGEEISNETGRAILSKLFEGVTSVSMIASSLGVSMQLVGWHIQRLSDVGLISINRVEQSRKNKQIHHYEPRKFALIIVPEHVAKSSDYLMILKKALTKTYSRLPLIGTFIGSSAIIYLTQILILNKIALQMNDPAMNQSYYPGLDLLYSLLGGIITTLATWLTLKLLKKRPN